MAEPSVLLFVYGTLMQGAANAFAGLLWAHAEDLGRYPGLADAPAAGGLVHGRLAGIRDEALLAILDEYEGEEFERQRRTATRADGSAVEAWVYVYTGAFGGAAVIESGRWPLE